MFILTRIDQWSKHEYKSAAWCEDGDGVTLCLRGGDCVEDDRERIAAVGFGEDVTSRVWNVGISAVDDVRRSESCEDFIMAWRGGSD